MRAPFALDCSPAPSSMMPALTISSLNFAIAPSISSDGILPASESLVALTITMKRIGLSLGFCRLVDARSAQIVGMHGADFFRRLRLAARGGHEARPDPRVGDPHCRAAFA